MKTNDRIICSVSRDSESAEALTEDLANADIIAAALQMLEALNGLLQHCVSVKGMPEKGKGRTEEQQIAFDKAVAVISAATGAK